MIDDKGFAQRWNQAGPECTADMLKFIFHKVETPADAAHHNLMLDFMRKRMNDGHLQRFFLSVADLIEQYSVESMKDGKTQKEKAS